MKARKNQVVEETRQSFYEQLYNNYSGLTDGEIFIDQYDGKSNLGIKATSAITIYDGVYTEDELDNMAHFNYIPPNIEPIMGFVVGEPNYTYSAKKIILPTSISDTIDRTKYNVWVYYVPSATPFYNHSRYASSHGIYNTGTLVDCKGEECGISDHRTVRFYGTNSYAATKSDGELAGQPYYIWNCIKFLTSGRMECYNVQNDGTLYSNPYASRDNNIYQSGYQGISFTSYNDGILGDIYVYETNNAVYDRIRPSYNSTTNKYGFFSHRTKIFEEYSTSSNGHVYPIIDKKNEERDNIYYGYNQVIQQASIVCVKYHGEDVWRDTLNIWKRNNTGRLAKRGQYNVNYYTTQSDGNGGYVTYGWVTRAYEINGTTYETELCSDSVNIPDGDGNYQWAMPSGWQVVGTVTDYKTMTVKEKEGYYYYKWDGTTKTYTSYTRDGSELSTTWSDTSDYVYTIDDDKSVHKKTVQRAAYDNDGTTVNTDLYRLGSETTLDISTSLPNGYTAISSFHLPAKFFEMQNAITNNAFYISLVLENTSTASNPKRILESGGFTGQRVVHWALESSTRLLFTPYTSNYGDNRKNIVIDPWPSIWKTEQLYNCFKVTDVSNDAEYTNGADNDTSSNASNRSIYLGGYKYNGNYCKLKVIGLMITDIATGTLTHFLLPAQNDSTSTDGLYDMITGTFYS